MTTTTDRAADLRAEIADYELQMGAHFGDPVQFATYLAKRGAAMRELRQMEENR